MLSMVSSAGYYFVLSLFWLLVQSMCLWFGFDGAFGIKAHGYKSQSTTPTKYQIPKAQANYTKLNKKTVFSDF